MHPFSTITGLEQGSSEFEQTGKRACQEDDVNVIQNKDKGWRQIFGLQWNKQVAPFIKPMQETESCQPGETPCQIQPRGTPGLQRNCQTQDKKHQSIDKIDDFVIDVKEILDEVHR